MTDKTKAEELAEQADQAADLLAGENHLGASIFVRRCAAELRRLAAEVEALREALTDIGDADRLNSYGDPGVLRDYARTALECARIDAARKEQ